MPTPSAAPTNEIMRPPVVVVLGHVDHGKTTLLDAIRKTNIAAGESGGITQHIGAYQAQVNDRIITFLDTPGHEAFTAIRSRGAKVADVAILVVAADESVKPQTKEAIKIIQEAGIPMVVAINKVDKPGANIDKIKQDLAQENILVESWGGQVPAVEISAKQGAGISELLDMVILVSDLLELKATLNVTAKGVIIESNKDPQRGYVATALVQEGVLRVGDWIVVGHVVGKVKSMEDFRSQTVTEAEPSQPVQITGWQESPRVGMPFRTAPAKKAAEELAADSITPPPVPFESFRKSAISAEDEHIHTLNVIFKTDVASSLEAIELSISAIHNDQVVLRVLDAGVGNITEADVKTASAKGAIIMGFHVAVEPAAQKLAERDGITIRTFDIIYELIEGIRNQLTELLPAQTQRTVVGRLKVLALFKKEGKHQILGGKVTSGKAEKSVLVDLVKGDVITRVGKLTQVQHNKEEMDSVKEGLEAGLRIDISSFSGDIQVGDTLEFIEEESVKQSL